ncbi:esterase FE4 isoform X2 [Orussus abietinus]|uniref:esterase FE4 isoform X2 n=1 Tax=Orussus abietinus TaxID=222816 RepID=UPI000C715D62|nr:esterase FE4 isoform X2 [Orussus abietinus]
MSAALLTLLLCAVAKATEEQPSATPVQVETPSGSVIGSCSEAKDGQGLQDETVSSVCAFQGLRYAQPPVGEYRFQQAVPVYPWMNVFDATKQGPSCFDHTGTSSSEDCLRLNIYTTEPPPGSLIMSQTAYVEPSGNIVLSQNIYAREPPGNHATNQHVYAQQPPNSSTTNEIADAQKPLDNRSQIADKESSPDGRPRQETHAQTHPDSDKNKNSGIPILVYFPPDRYYSDSDREYVEGPLNLLRPDIILVTVSYRVQALGFISTGDSAAPGNLGLKDQVEALRWIRKNIAAFGGDPNSVTIAGYSNSARDVILHMLSPLSKGLFHKVIAMNGAPTFPEPLPTHQRDIAEEQAELLNCPTDTSSNMIRCLKTRAIDDFERTLSKLKRKYYDPFLTWSPVVEPVINGVERFLTAQPYDLLREGNFHQVPLIVGFTKYECGRILAGIIDEYNNSTDLVLSYMNENWKRIAASILQYEGTEYCDEIGDQLREYYFQEYPINDKTADALANFYLDSIVAYPVYRLVDLVSAASCEPVYYYQIEYKQPVTVYAVQEHTAASAAVAYQDDQMVIFYESLYEYVLLTQATTLSDQRVAVMWTNFAKTGEPVPQDNDSFKNVVWDAFTPLCQLYLHITDMRHMKSHDKHGFNIWERLFPWKRSSHRRH